jgi:hypothetical protein
LVIITRVATVGGEAVQLVDQGVGGDGSVDEAGEAFAWGVRR